MTVRPGPARPARGLSRRIAVVHPFPSALNSVVVLGLALLAGATTPTAIALAVAMLFLQFCIGAANDVVDEPLDRRTKPWKPIPSGSVSRRTALGVAASCAVVSLLVAASQGLVVLSLAACMLGAGLAYDLWLKPTPWSWVAYAVALPILPVYAWWGAASALPPRAELLLPMAVLAGPALQLTNSIVDVERDRAGGIRSLAAALGPRRALALAATAVATIHVLAWATLLTIDTTPAVILAAAVSTGAALAGLSLSASASEAARERGWQAQTVSIGLLALAWLAAAVR